MNLIYRCVIALTFAVLCSAQTSFTGPNAIGLASAGYQVRSPLLAVAPGQVIVLHVTGITTVINQNLVPVPGSSGFPHSLNGISVDLIQGKAGTATSLELRAAYQTHCLAPCNSVTGITLQIPFELETNFFVNGDPDPYLRISQNGTVVGGVALNPVTDNLHVLNTCDDTQTYISAAVSVPQNICSDVVMGNGAINSLYNLAHGGDELAVWLYGMGAISQPGSNCCSDPSQLSQPVQKFALNFDFRPNEPADPVVPGFGLTATPLFVAYVGSPYQLNFAVPPVPAGLPACDGVKIKSNLTVTVTGPNSSDALHICVAP